MIHKKYDSNYTLLNKYILRTPILPIESIAKFIFSELDVIKFCKSDVKYLEAIYLSSPDLYFEFVKILNGNLKSNKQRNKILLSVTKYLLRMATKCTPFGVLSKSSIGGISQNKIGKQILSDEVQRIVQLDTSLVNKLAKYLQRFPQFKELLNYYPNNTIYRVNNEICFFSCHLDESNSQYSISRIEESDLLDTILNWSKDGIIYKELLGLIRNKFSVQNASSILDGLIDKEFLISDYEKNLNTSLFLQASLDIIASIETKCDSLLKAELVLKDASKILNNLQLGNEILMYEELYNLFRSLSISIERNKILYINSICDLKESNLNVKIVEEISEVIEIVSYFINQRQNVALEKFKIEYQNRYQEQELPLAQVLDPINGIGYILSESNLYVEKLLAEYLLLEDNNKVEKGIKSNSCSDIDLYLIELYVKAVKNSSYQIEISLDDIKDKLILNNNLSRTISILVNFVNVDHTLNKYWIHFKDISSFAIRSLSRFSLFNSEISDICENLSNIESDVSKNSIRAEIIHVPNLKVANIMQRKIFYQNEISLITRNKDFKNTQINYNDLFISIQNNRIVLRSKKLNKKVLPSLSNAYNFNITEFPVFKFLCELL